MSTRLPRPTTPVAGAQAPSDGGADPTPEETVVLEFERDWAGTARAKEAAIRSQLGLSATRYYRLLHRAIDDPSALVQDPMLVRRLQRLRTARARVRASRTFRTD